MGSKSQTSSSTTAANPQAQQAYLSLLGQAQTVGATPYTPYTGELVPGVNAQQTTGINNINSSANYAQPYIQQAAGLATQASTPLTAAQIQQYQSPYTQGVVNATQAQFNNQNAQQLQGVKGNAIAQGALGGNREAVAEAETTNQQQLAQAPVIAGLENQGYQTGLNTALAEQQAQAQGAYSLGNLGVSGQNAALTGANAQVGAGNLQYGVSSATDQAAYQQFLNQQAFPYQQLQWQAGIDTGVGSALGGTSTTTAPGPSVLSQIAGLGTAAVGVAGGTGGFGSNGYLNPNSSNFIFKRGGRVQGLAMGGVPYGGSGTPYGGGTGYMPAGPAITRGRGAPPAPGLGNQNQLQQQMNQIGSLAKSFGNNSGGISTSPTGAGFPQVGSPDAAQFDANGYPIANFSDPGIGFASGPHASGGRIGFADGGTPQGLAGIPDWLSDAQYTPSPGIVQAQDYTSLPDDVIDARIPEGSGGYGRGVAVNWTPEQEAALADVNRSQLADDGGLPPEITQGHSGPIVVPQNQALSYTTPAGIAPTQPDYAGVDDPDSAYNRSVLGSPATAATTSGLTYEHPHTDPWGALMAAGLGMMASRSPFAGVAIGEGGLAGLHEYSAEQAQNIGEAEKKTNLAQQNKRIDLESTRLDQVAKNAQDQLNLKTKEQSEGTWYQQQEAAKPVPMGQHVDPTTLMPMQTYGVRQPDGSLKPVELPASASPPDGSDHSSGLISPAAIHDMAISYVKSGNTAVMQNLGFGKQAGVNRARLWNEIESVLKDSGATGQDLAAARVNFTAQSAGARTAAVRGANVDMSIQEAQQTFPLALDASAAVPRSQFVPWNKAVQMVQAGTSSPELARYVTANQAVITAYAQAMSRANVTTDHSRHRAEELLSTATSPEAYQAVLDQMGKEMHAAQLAPEAVRKDIESKITGRPVVPATVPPASATTPAAVVSAADKQALDWANANPNDPRAAQIKQRLGVQ